MIMRMAMVMMVIVSQPSEHCGLRHLPPPAPPPPSPPPPPPPPLSSFLSSLILSRTILAGVLDPF